jgi:transposase
VFSLQSIAARVRFLSIQLAELDPQLLALIKQYAAGPALLAEPGAGPVVAAQLLISWSHQGRVRNDAAFASLAGVAPIEASSGQRFRHRLNRGGDRALNRALHTVATTRMRCHPRPAPTSCDAALRATPTATSDASSSEPLPDVATDASRPQSS